MRATSARFMPPIVPPKLLAVKLSGWTMPDNQQAKSPWFSRAFGLCWTVSDFNLGAEGRTRTGTGVAHHPLKMACLPIPPLRLFTAYQGRRPKGRLTAFQQVLYSIPGPDLPEKIPAFAGGRRFETLRFNEGENNGSKNWPGAFKFLCSKVQIIEFGWPPGCFFEPRALDLARLPKKIH